MSNLGHREHGFEGQFQHDEEMRFKARARQIGIFGAWIAEQMGLSETERQSYVRELLDADFNSRGQIDLVAQARKDLVARKIDISEHRLGKERDQALALAKQQIVAEA